ncbi:MAG TPA: NADH-quinone oxidoreductase subunit C [Peptococcaceae bacterium]|nr:NADH-quinone oxidoreductase subunit C [Peptococcaceae bacterium]
MDDISNVSKITEPVQKRILAKIAAAHPEINVSEAGHLHVPVDSLTAVMRDLKENFGFDYLSNVTAVDYLEYMNVVYDLCRVGTPYMLHIIVRIDRENPVVPSMVPLWGGALWQEREIYDLLGVIFTKHPDLRRILLDDTWEDHPLRRDYQWMSGRD